jgi:ABC-type antimicrobial peptide transport system permease subunit
MWDALRLDVRHSFRSLRRAPTFSLIVIVTLALAIGATAAVGSLLNALVLRRLAVPGPEQLVALSALEPRANVDGYFYVDTFNAYRVAQRSFAQMSMYFGGGLLRVETHSGVFEDASTEAVSPSYVDIVGARLSAGRFFAESDDAVVVISEGFRRRLFGNGPGIGEAIKVNTVPATVIGVMADGFDGLQIHGTTDIIVPFAVTRAATGDVSRPFRSRVLAFVVALPLAWGIIRVVTASLVSPRGPARFPSGTPDAGVIAATALLTMGIGLAIGVVSAWPSVAVRVDEGLRRGRGVIGSLGPFGRGLLVAQVALTMTLLVGAGLFTTTLAHLRANDTSLQSQRIVFTRAFREPGDRALLPPGYYQALVTELTRMPAADAAALSVYYPTYFGLKVAVPTDYRYTRADGVTPLDGTVLTDFVSPGFFDLFRFHLLKGRDVSWDDGPGKPAVALISASLARAVFPAGDEIGQHIRIAGPDRRDVEVIGVVADAPYVKLDDPTPLVVFRPIMQETARTQFPMAYVRAKGDLATVRDGYTRVIKSLGHRSLRAFITSSDWVDGALVQERFTAALATFAAALTVLLTCMGVYGLVAYSVTARKREIGVRVALGATRRSVVRMIVRDGLAIAVPGVLIGAPCAWAAARLVRAQLYGIAPGDPRTLLLGAAILLATVLAASLLPALRASRVAPVEALREE